MKKLGRKNLTYSMLLAAVMLLFLVGYFIWMLPSLYISYVGEQNVEAVKKQHQTFMETGTYDGVQVRNPAACISVKIPFEENYIELASKMISVKITASDAETAELMDGLQAVIGSIDFKYGDLKDANKTGWEKESEKMLQIKEKLETICRDRVQMPVDIEILHIEHAEALFYGESVQIHEVSKERVILESAVQDDDNQYTNYFVAEKTSDAVVLSFLPVITPQMDEIRPVVMQSLPMLCAVIIIMVLVFSQIYSEGIVRPVYEKLQDINHNLQEENERQEMFLRASSHQLKTPVTAALLLLDGMINQIGKYKDTKTYLPKVKEQLLSMRRMIEEILLLHRNRSTVSGSEICLYDLIQAQLASYRVTAADKHLEISVKGDRTAWIWTDADILAKIIDNLLSNAIAYTPPGNQILISLDKNTCMIRNEGVTIPANILSHIYEPFVRGGHQTMSHGLGLYIAAYYAKMMDARLSIQNKDGGVEAVFQWH